MNEDIKHLQAILNYESDNILFLYKYIKFQKLNIFKIIENILRMNDNIYEMYEKNNFKVIHKREKYYGNDDALIMKRDV